eukprot:GILK01002239.1.p1 GENE.GILK01002239.1~~GILK01002239.1.p1  ORF type:complete len:502 (-),score=104.27 GILK01002239.1:267-1772(-)
MSRPNFRPRPIDINRKLPVVRSVDDLTFEDENGTMHTITNLDEAGLGEDSYVVQTEQKVTKQKNIPIPDILEVPNYAANYGAKFERPPTYIRYRRKTEEELNAIVEYDLLLDDEEWLKKFNGGKNTLSEDKMELMIDAFEKATGSGAEIIIYEGVRLVQTKGIFQRQAVIEAVWQYWKEKRKRLKRPLLRRFWPPPNPDDTSPNVCFRPRERERMKLRKPRKNDSEMYQKMKRLKDDFEKLRRVLELVKRRERTKKDMLKTEQMLLDQQRGEKFDPNYENSEWKVVRLATRQEKLTKTKELADKLKQAALKRKIQQQALASSGVTPAPKKRPAPPLDDDFDLKHVDKAIKFEEEEGTVHFGFELAAAAAALIKAADNKGWEYDTFGVKTSASGRSGYRSRGRVGRGGRIIIDRQRDRGYRYSPGWVYPKSSLSPHNPGFQHDNDTNQSDGSSRMESGRKQFDNLYVLSDSDEDFEDVSKRLKRTIANAFRNFTRQKRSSST